MNKLALIIFAVAAVIPAYGQWTYTLTNWSGAGARTQLWEALEERWEGFGYTNLSDSVDQPNWWFKRAWLLDFDSTLENICAEYIDLRYVTNNTLDGWFAADTNRIDPPMWTFSNLLVYVDATNKPHMTTGTPQFSNYRTNGSIRWPGAFNFKFYKERKDALNQLLITLPDSYQFAVTSDFIRAGTGSSNTIAAAQLICETNYAADTTNSPGQFDVATTFDTNVAGANAAMELSGWKVAVTHDPLTTQYASRAIFYAESTWPVDTFSEFSDNGLGWLDNVYGQTKWTNDFSVGDSGVWTSGFIVVDSTNALEWFGGVIDTNSPSALHKRGMTVQPRFVTFDYSVSNGFDYVP